MRHETRHDIEQATRHDTTRHDTTRHDCREQLSEWDHRADTTIPMLDSTDQHDATRHDSRRDDTLPHHSHDTAFRLPVLLLLICICDQGQKNRNAKANDTTYTLELLTPCCFLCWPQPEQKRLQDHNLAPPPVRPHLAG